MITVLDNNEAMESRKNRKRKGSEHGRGQSIIVNFLFDIKGGGIDFYFFADNYCKFYFL